VLERAGNGKGNRRSFDSATRGKTASSFTQDDNFGLVWKRTGNGKNRGKGRGAMRGSLHCATDGGTVRHFGRDGASLVGNGNERFVGGEGGNGKSYLRSESRYPGKWGVSTGKNYSICGRFRPGVD
jgi:hypothetical protein